jgi:hypothetical protein
VRVHVVCAQLRSVTHTSTQDEEAALITPGPRYDLCEFTYEFILRLMHRINIYNAQNA